MATADRLILVLNAGTTSTRALAFDPADRARWTSLGIDGGMAANDWLAQDLADMLALLVERPDMVETTARGAQERALTPQPLLHPVAQADQRGRGGAFGLAPDAIEPAQAGVEILGCHHELADLGIEHRQPGGIARFGLLRELAVAAQLELAEVAGKVGAVIEQPGDSVHHPRRRAQRLARQRNAGKIVLGGGVVEPAGQGERAAHFVGQHQRLAIEALDDARIDGERF